MKQINLRQNFYSSIIRSVLILLALILLLVLAPQATMLHNQKLTINDTTVSGVEIARVLISLFIVSILLNFAYVCETLLPKIVERRFKHGGLVISSALHIAVIFIAYSYLVHFATDDTGNVNQVFNASFLLLLCIPLIRGGIAINGLIKDLTGTLETNSIKCDNCGANNDQLAKFCKDCGKPLSSIPSSPVTVICNKCGLENDASSKFCANCGSVLPTKSQYIICPQCGAENKQGAKYCIDCGSALTIHDVRGKLKEKNLQQSEQFKISVAHPRYISKRFESAFLLQFYIPERRSQVMRNIRLEFQAENIGEHTQSSLVKSLQMVKIKLFSPAFDFPGEVTKLLDDVVNKITLLGMPKDNCESGLHKVLVSISDADTDQEFESLTINVQVVDFAFDHVSRPLLSRVSAVVLGIGSFVMFMLTFLEQIDKTFGLASGTAAGVLAIAIYANFYNLYQRVHPSTP